MEVVTGSVTVVVAGSVFGVVLGVVLGVVMGSANTAMPRVKQSATQRIRETIFFIVILPFLCSYCLISDDLC